MSDIHILELSGGRQKLVFHVAIPAGNNPSGIPWRTALINSGMGGTTSLKDGDGTQGTISGAEKTSITTGAIYEVTTIPKRFKNASGAQIDELYAGTASATIAGLQTQLAKFGATR